jgi:hypothetical protein
MLHQHGWCTPQYYPCIDSEYSGIDSTPFLRWSSGTVLRPTASEDPLNRDLQRAL